MEAWGSLIDCLCESYFDEYLKNFEMALRDLYLSTMCAKHG